MTWNKIIYSDDILECPFIILEKTNDYEITTDDLDKCISLNDATSDVIFELPNVDEYYIGRKIICYNLSDALLKIIPYDGTIEGSNNISSAEKYSAICLIITGVNQWEIFSVDGFNIVDEEYFGGWMLTPDPLPG